MIMMKVIMIKQMAIQINDDNTDDDDDDDDD